MTLGLSLNYLDSRYQYWFFTIHLENLTLKPVAYGILQGSLLNPFLFKLWLSDKGNSTTIGQNHIEVVRKCIILDTDSVRNKDSIMGSDYVVCEQNREINRKFWLVNIFLISFCQILK